MSGMGANLCIILYRLLEILPVVCVRARAHVKYRVSIEMLWCQVSYMKIEDGSGGGDEECLLCT